MTESDDSTAKEIAAKLATVLPLVGCPRWLLWFGVTLGVVLYVVGKHLVPRIGDAIVQAWANAKIEPAPLPISDGGEAGDRDLAPATDPNAYGVTDPMIADLRQGSDKG